MVKTTSKRPASGKVSRVSADDGPSSSGASRAAITLRKKSDKKKSLSEIMNEQFDEEAHYGSAPGFDDEDGGVMEDYEAVEPGQADEEQDGLRRSSLAAGKKRARASSAAVPLRRRGPLDDALSTGKYAATPISVEAAMDDLFGGLDMADLDEEADAFVDGGSDDDMEDEKEEDGKGRSKRSKAAEENAKKKKKRVKDLSEEEYMAYLEEQGQKKKMKRQLASKTTSGLGVSSSFATGADEMDVLQQLEELRANQIQLVKGEAGKGAGKDASGAEASPGDEAERRQRIRDAVQYQIMLYSQLLRLRVKLQPAVMRAIAMPQYYARSLFTTEPPRGGSVEEEERKALNTTRKSVVAKYKSVKAELEEFLASLFADANAAMHGDGAPQQKKRKTEGGVAEEAGGACPDLSALQTFHKKVIQHAHTCLSFWGSRLAPSNNIANQNEQKLQAIHQPITSQIEALLQSKSRLRIKVQKNRSHIPIVAHPEHLRASSWFAAATSGPERDNSALEQAKTVRATRIAEGDVDEEIFDDGDFLRELVRRGGAVAAQLDQQLTEVRQEIIASSGGVTGEGSKKGFHRLTKGKSLDFNPRPKLVGFMVAEPWDSCNPPRSEVIVRSLFQ